MTPEDRYTNTEADAGRYEAHYGSEYRDDDRPDPADLDWIDITQPPRHLTGPLADAFTRAVEQAAGWNDEQAEYVRRYVKDRTAELRGGA